MEGLSLYFHCSLSVCVFVCESVFLFFLFLWLYNYAYNAQRNIASVIVIGLNALKFERRLNILQQLSKLLTHRNWFEDLELSQCQRTVKITLWDYLAERFITPALEDRFKPPGQTKSWRLAEVWVRIPTGLTCFKPISWIFFTRFCGGVINCKHLLEYLFQTNSNMYPIMW